ncbi:hypothetical protein P7C71_g4336, partial [Lecanoromycetidae sp. Uapishka_2]
MSFFDEEPYDPTLLPEDVDPRVYGWNGGRIQTAATPGYERQAKQAQAAATNVTKAPTIQNGIITRAVHAKPRPSLPSNVRGFKDMGSGGAAGWDAPNNLDRDPLPADVQGQNWGKGRPLNSARPSAWTKGPPATTGSSKAPANAGSSKAPAWSAKDLTSMVPEVQGSPFKTPVDKATGSPSQTAGLSSAAKARLPPPTELKSSVKSMKISSSTGPQSREEKEPSRHAQSFASRASEQAPAAAQKKSTMSSGTIYSDLVKAQLRAPSQETAPDLSWTTPPSQGDKVVTKMNAGKAAKSAKFDSPFPCTYEECTRGFLKERDMKRHKDEDHEWCRVCNKDFEDDEALLSHKIDSERHICCPKCGEDFRSEAGRDRHQRQQEVKCVGCGLFFEKGSGLIDHIYHNKCSNKGGSMKGQLNELTLRESRATAALYMDQIAHQKSTTARDIAALQRSAQGSIADYESTAGGGVNLLVDDDIPKGNMMQRPLAPAGTLQGQDAPKPDTNPWPTVGESLVQGLDAMQVGGSKGNMPQPRVRGHKSAGWADTPFAVEKPTPIKGDWTAPTMPDYRNNFLPSQVGAENVLRTDWDFMRFEKHPIDNNYHCPFTACGSAYVDEDDLKAHLTSGYHQGTDHRCLKCLKVFKTPVALIAHMESSSERCRMKETQSFGNVLHIVSGGFLGVQGRHTDGSIKIEGVEVENEEERYKMPVEDDEDRIPTQPVILLPHQRGIDRNKSQW